MNLDLYEATHKATAMVLTCIDYRFIQTGIDFLEASVLDDKFDLSTLAGASLGYNQKKFKCWRQTFEDLTKLAIQLHHITEIIVIDHMDCGAYAKFYPDLVKNSDEERALHVKNILKFVKTMKGSRRFGKLSYRGFLINLDGSVETVV